MSGLLETLSHVPWNTIEAADSIESSWGLFKYLFFTAVDSFVPKLRWRLKKFKHWFTYDTIHLIRKKRRLYLQLKKKDSATLLTEYKQLRNKVRYLTRLEARKYSESLSNQYFSNLVSSGVGLTQVRADAILFPL